MNDLSVSIYQPFSTTFRDIETAIITRVTDISFSTFFPGGLYGAASFFVPMDITTSPTWTVADRVVIRNGLEIVWEGEIAGIGHEIGGGAMQGIRLDCAGWWHQLLGRITIDRRWADNRLGEDAWVINNAAAAVNYADRQLADDTLGRRLKIIAKNVAWANTDRYDLLYTMPTGETVGRVEGSYRLAEDGGQDWNINVSSTDGSHNFLNTGTSGTGSIASDHSGTPTQSIRYSLVSNAAQTPSADGSTRVRLSDLFVFRYTSAQMSQVQIDEIVKDCRSSISNLNSDEGNIDTPGSALALEPFYTKGPESWAKVLERAAGHGDATFNEWYVRLISSERAATPDGKPVLESKQYPALTAFDYAVRLDEENLVPPVRIVQDTDGIANWIIIEYREEDDNRNVILTPDDNANLTDTTSTTDYGQRDLIVNIGIANSTTALNIGRKILAARKNPQWHVSGPIQVRGYIRGLYNERVPASQIESGKRIKLENFLDDLAPSGSSGAGLTFYITKTQYTDSDEVCSISTGVPDDIAVMLAQLDFKFT